MKEPLEHVARPQLPWRSDRLTECGKPESSVRVVITRDEMVRKFRDQGKRRASLSTCMTCWETTEWNRDWAQSPSEVLAREWRRVSGGAFGPTDTQLDRELRAIAALIEAHREEFDGFLAGLDDVGSLDAKREAKRQQAVQRVAL